MLLLSEMDDDARYNRKFRVGLYTLQWASEFPVFLLSPVFDRKTIGEPPTV